LNNIFRLEDEKIKIRHWSTKAKIYEQVRIKSIRQIIDEIRKNRYITDDEDYFLSNYLMNYGIL